MRLLVTGDRNWRNVATIPDGIWEVVEDFANGMLQVHLIDVTLVNGYAPGVDTIADVCFQLALLDDTYGRGSTIERFPALWDQHGRAAGPIRNQQMLDSGIDMVAGFHNDIRNSRGTRDMLRRCALDGIPGRLFTEEGEVPHWQTIVI